MLELANYQAFYGDSHILHDINIKLDQTSRVAVLGRNGAGKSTLLKSIMNAGPTTRGHIAWHGRDISAVPAHKRAAMGLCLVPEDRHILADLTVAENIKMAAQAMKHPDPNGLTRSVIARFPMLVPIENRMGGVLSGGQQQLLALARAVAAKPKLLLLDEPTEGLAPIIVDSLVEHIQEMLSEGEGGLCLCEQNIRFSRRCTDYVYVLDAGRLVFSGTWEAFDADPSIKANHLAV